MKPSIDSTKPSAVPEDLDRVRDVAVKLVEKMHTADYLVAVHSDAAGGHAHAHIIVMNHDYLTGKALQRHTSWRHGLHQLNDEVMKQEGLNVLPNPQQPKPTWSQRRESFSAGGFEQVLGDKVYAAFADSRSVDRAGFEEVLAEHGVKLAVTDRDGWSFRMRREDNGKIGRKKASGLSDEFTAENAQEIFDYHLSKRRNNEFTSKHKTARRTARGYGDIESVDLDRKRDGATFNESNADGFSTDLARARAKLDEARQRELEEIERNRENARKRSPDSEHNEKRNATQRREYPTSRPRRAQADAANRETDYDDGFEL